MLYEVITVADDHVERSGVLAGDAGAAVRIEQREYAVELDFVSYNFV